jgi:hypothetical protein
MIHNNQKFMQRSTWFLKATLVLMGLAVAGLCVGAVWAGFDDKTGLYRPVMFGLPVTAIPFFVALYQAWKLLNNIDKNEAFSPLSIQALRNIKLCAITITALYAILMPFIFIAGEKDDAPGAILMGLVLMCAPIVVAVFAALLQKLLQNGMDIKSENELTV